MVNYMESYTVGEDGTLKKNEKTKEEEEEEDRALELIEKYGSMAKDVAIDILDSFKHEDNRMYYEICFYEKVISILSK